jgi:hypothetical protein
MDPTYILFENVAIVLIVRVLQLLLRHAENVISDGVVVEEVEFLYIL